MPFKKFGNQLYKLITTFKIKFFTFYISIRNIKAAFGYYVEVEKFDYTIKPIGGKLPNIITF